MGDGTAKLVGLSLAEQVEDVFGRPLPEDNDQECFLGVSPLSSPALPKSILARRNNLRIGSSRFMLSIICQKQTVIYMPTMDSSKFRQTHWWVLVDLFGVQAHPSLDGKIFRNQRKEGISLIELNTLLSYSSAHINDLKNYRTGGHCRSSRRSDQRWGKQELNGR
jgi:hypothetical protein